MRKLLILCVVITFVIVGCSFLSKDNITSRDPDAIGLVYEVYEERQSILVVSDIDDINIDYDEWFAAGNYAAVFSTEDDTTYYKGNYQVDFDSLKKGQEVKVWHTGSLAESYPMQGVAIKIVIID